MNKKENKECLSLLYLLVGEKPRPLSYRVSAAESFLDYLRRCWPGLRLTAEQENLIREAILANGFDVGNWVSTAISIVYPLEVTNSLDHAAEKLVGGLVAGAQAIERWQLEHALFEAAYERLAVKLKLGEQAETEVAAQLRSLQELPCACSAGVKCNHVVAFEAGMEGSSS